MYSHIELYEEPREVMDAKCKEGICCEMSRLQHGFLCGLLKKYHPHKIVEVGMAEGGTTAVIMKCLEMIQSDAQIYSVDLNKQCYCRKDKITGYQMEEVKEELRNYSNHNLVLGCILPEVIDNIGEGIDFVVLDTVHCLPGELLDFLCILPYLNNRAIIVMHDTVLNFSGCASACCATKILFDVASGKKYFHYENRDLRNIAAIEMNESTRELAANLFSALSITWNYIPDDFAMNCYRNIYRRYYDKECNKLLDIFYQEQLYLSDKKRYFFVERRNMVNVCSLADIEMDTDKIYHYFMENDDEVLYILDMDGRLYGVVSRGDLYRSYQNQDHDLKINQNFYAVYSSGDFDAADKVFTILKTLHEVPTVENGILTGVIRKVNLSCPTV